MTKKWRKIVAICSVLAGLALVVFELRPSTSTGGWESCFWLGLGVVLLIMGAIDLFSRGGDGDIKEE